MPDADRMAWREARRQKKEKCSRKKLRKTSRRMQAISGLDSCDHERSQHGAFQA